MRTSSDLLPDPPLPHPVLPKGWCFVGSSRRRGAHGDASHSVRLLVLLHLQNVLSQRQQQHWRGDPRRHIVQRQINYFEYYGRWSDEEAALYTLGCVGGVTAWLLAFVSAALDARTASKQHAGSSMPVAKCAPHAATFVVPLVPVPRELATPHHPCSRTNSGEELLSKTAALLQAEDDLQLLPGTPVQEDARAKC